MTSGIHTHPPLYHYALHEVRVSTATLRRALLNLGYRHCRHSMT